MQKKLTFVTMFDRIMEASNWTAYDNAHVVDGNHVVCFESTAKTEKMKSLLRIIVDLFNRQHSNLSRREDFGAVVFENSRNTGASSIVGIIEATPKELERQYNNIKEILKPMGLCESFSRRLCFDNEPKRNFTLTATESNKRSTSYIKKIALSIGKKVREVNLLAEASSSIDFASSAEQSVEKKADVDFGAVRSALLVNMFSKDAGTGGLNSITAMDSVLCSYRRMGKSEALHNIDRDLYCFDKKIETVADVLVNNIQNNIYMPINRKYAKGAYDDDLSRHASTAINNLRLVAEDIAKSNVSADTFSALMDADDIFTNILGEKFVSGAINYCLHGIMLHECLKHTRDKILLAKAETEKRAPENKDDMDIVSSSLGFLSLTSSPP